MLFYRVVREGLSREVTCEKRPEGNEGSDSHVSEGACWAEALREGTLGAVSETAGAGARVEMKTPKRRAWEHGKDTEEDTW